MSVRVTSGDFVRNVGYWLNEALLQPVEITHHNRVKLILAAPGDKDPDDEELEEKPKTTRE